MYVKYLKEFLIKTVFMGFIGGAECMKVALVELQISYDYNCPLFFYRIYCLKGFFVSSLFVADISQSS